MKTNYKELTEPPELTPELTPEQENQLLEAGRDEDNMVQKEKISDEDMEARNWNWITTDLRDCDLRAQKKAMTPPKKKREER